MRSPTVGSGGWRTWSGSICSLGHHLWIGFHAVPQAPNGDLIQPMSSLGKPGYRSHGCVRQHPTNAATLYAVTPVGGKVVVIA